MSFRDLDRVGGGVDINSVHGSSMPGSRLSERSDLSGVGSGYSASHFVGNRQNNQAFARETMSELFDNQEKSAIFQHSMKHGLFNNIKNSPLKDKMPTRMQMYEPSIDNQLFAKESK